MKSVTGGWSYSVIDRVFHVEETSVAAEGRVVSENEVGLGYHVLWFERWTSLCPEWCGSGSGYVAPDTVVWCCVVRCGRC